MLGGNMMISNLISENPYSPSPRGHLGTFEIVGREELTIDIWDFIYRASKKKFIPSIIRAPYGGGKTTYLKWLRDNIKNPNNHPSYIKNKKILIAYTKLSHPTIQCIVVDFLNTIKNEITEEKRNQFLKHVDTIITELEKREITKNSYFYSILYRNILDLLYAQNNDVIIHIIDEYEAISEIPPEDSRGFLHEFRDFVDEINERPMLMILGCTDEAYRLMEEIHPALISRIPEDFKKNIVTRLNFTLENTLDFVSQRLEVVREKTPEGNNPYYPFTRKNIEIIYNKSGGNIRTIEQTCYFALEHSLKNDVELDDKAILDSLHKVLSEKKGREKKEAISNLIDDPKEKEAYINKIQKGNPEDLKKLLLNGFKEFLLKQNFDYQFQFESDILGEEVALAQIFTHAYRTTPINVTFFCSTIPKDLGHSDFVDAEKIRTYYNGSLCIILRIVEHEKNLTIKENIIEVCIPWKNLEEFTILNYITNLDVTRISRKLEDEFNIILNINNWIKLKYDEGNIIGNRFKQHEMSIYKILWVMGNNYNTLDEIYQYSRKHNRKYTKITLSARLKTLEDKNLVTNELNKYKWQISPLMKKIYSVIKEKFENNPIMPLDLIKYFMGGSKVMLSKYMILMCNIGIIETIKVGRSTAYKINYSTEDIDNINTTKKEIKNYLSKNTNLPQAILQKINNYNNEIQESFNYIKENPDNHIINFANLHRINHIYKLIKDQIKIIIDDSLILKNKKESLLNQIKEIKNLIKMCNSMDLDVESYNQIVKELTNKINHIYEIDYNELGKITESVLKYDEYLKELENICNNIEKIYLIHQKLISDVSKSEKIVESITQMHDIENIQTETINEITNYLNDAKKALLNKEYTMTEFFLLKILQNNQITKINYNYNIKISELEITSRELAEIAKISSRFNPSVNYLVELQNVDSFLKQAKTELETYDLIQVNQYLENASKKIDLLRIDTIKEIIAWFSEILDKDNQTSPFEISKTWGLPFDTVLQAIHILLMHNRVGVVWR